MSLLSFILFLRFSICLHIIVVTYNLYFYFSNCFNFSLRFDSLVRFVLFRSIHIEECVLARRGIFGHCTQSARFILICSKSHKISNDIIFTFISEQADTIIGICFN